ncbi:histidine kinase [Marinactinospora rubrisoli]|uniref:histidine kinase n=1 Tax=Marinactinospora rubrisoli TaxID=2715399 RepID=A0ABW2KEG1_9ACTN
MGEDQRTADTTGGAANDAHTVSGLVRRALRDAVRTAAAELPRFTLPTVTSPRAVLGGICAGFADRRGWPLLLVRLMCVVLLLPALAYPVVWLVRIGQRPEAHGRDRANRQLFLALVAAAVTAADTAQLGDAGLPTTLAAVAGLLLGLPVILVGRSPLVAWRWLTAALPAVLFVMRALPGVFVEPPLATIACYLPLLFLVGTQYPRHVVAGVGGCTAAMAIVSWSTTDGEAAAVVWSIVLAAVLLIAGDNVRVRREAPTTSGHAPGDTRPERRRASIPVWDGVLDALWRAPTERPGGPFRLPEHPRRPVEGRLVAGVCRALAGGSPWRTVALRVLFSAGCLLGLTGGVLYLLLWLVLPDESAKPGAERDGADTEGGEPGRASGPASTREYLAWLLLFLTGAAVTSLTTVQIVSFFSLDVPIAVVLGLAMGLPLALVARSPLLTWRFMAVGLFALLLVAGVAGTPTPATVPGGTSPSVLWPWPVAVLLALPVVLYLVAISYPRRIAVGVGAVTVLFDVLAASLLAGTPLLQSLWVAAVAVAVLAYGRNVRARRTAQRELAQESALRRQDRARQAVLEERSRIARELHDVVSHHMSLIAIQAEAAPYKYPGLSPETTATFHTIRDTARDALTEMRRVVGLLRAEGEDAERAPQPGLDRLPDLVSGARQAGMRVTVDVTVPPDDLPSAVGLSVYRIVQESLSNAGRYAPGADVHVEVAHTDRLLVVRVRNSGAEESGGVPGLDSGGHGLVGMRERVAMLGGTLRAGPLPEGGFEVRAELPLADPSTD